MICELKKPFLCGSEGRRGGKPESRWGDGAGRESWWWQRPVWAGVPRTVSGWKGSVAGCLHSALNLYTPHSPLSWLPLTAFSAFVCHVLSHLKIVIICSLGRVRGKQTFLAPPKDSVFLPGQLRRLRGYSCRVLPPSGSLWGEMVGRVLTWSENASLTGYVFEKCSVTCPRPWEPEITPCLVPYFSLTWYKVLHWDEASDPEVSLKM